MTATNVQAPASPAAKVVAEATSPLPDYLLNPDAVLKDEAVWRFGKAPDYSNTRRAFAESKKMNHSEGSLELMVQNLVKNWEIEASFKTRLSDWRTIDLDSYAFAINGGPPQDAEYMLRVGTYNAIIAPNSFYSSEHSDFSQSHKIFKRIMPTFAWEVLEVYSGPPRVAFKWRHWGQMKSDYVGLNDNGEEITIKAHGGVLDIQGVTVALVNDKFQVTSLETWFDPLDMFRQFIPREVRVNDTSAGGEAATHLLQGSEGKQEYQSEVEVDMSEPLAPIGEVKPTHPIIEDQTSCQEARAADRLTIVVDPGVSQSKHDTGTPFETEVSKSITFRALPMSSAPPGHPEILTEGADSASCPFLLAQKNTKGPAASEIATPGSEIREKASTSSIPVPPSNTEQVADLSIVPLVCDPDKGLLPSITAPNCDIEEENEVKEREMAATQAVTPLTADVVSSTSPERHWEPVPAALTACHSDADSVLPPSRPEAYVEVVGSEEIIAPVDTSVVLPLQQREAQTEAVDTKIDFFNSSRDIRNSISMEISRDEPGPHHLVQGESGLQYSHKDSDFPAGSKQEPYTGACAETSVLILRNSEPTCRAPE